MEPSEPATGVRDAGEPWPRADEATPHAAQAFAPRCVSIDLEVGRKDDKIHRFAAIRGDTGAVVTFSRGSIGKAFQSLDELADGSAFLLGHNFVHFDAPHLAAAAPSLKLLELPQVDTLWLNPLAFPRNPYHHLVKHYQDGQLKRGRLNDPELDARIALEVFADQQQAFRDLGQINPDLLIAYHWLTTAPPRSDGYNAFFSTVRRAGRPSDQKARAAILRQIADKACTGQAEALINSLPERAWPMAYALAWLSVSGGNSVMPPWVRHQFPEAGRIIRRLRETPCDSSSCNWCHERHDARQELKRWFGFDEYRAEPAAPDGRSLQQAIVEAAMRGQHVLGILPTGTGKSVCYQVPALSRYDKTGSLTVVVSPLVALMADQVAGLEARGITACATINGLLSMPERSDVLDRVRLGDIGILIIAPEQLRSRTVRKVLSQREIGAWVLDEAHCLSKWGHDFRPDYRYVGRFIKEHAGQDPIPPVLCLTATAKPDVVDDILNHFRDRLGIELALLDGGAKRDNLDFVVVPTTVPEKFAHVAQVLESDLPTERAGGAIVYCATRAGTKEIAQFLNAKGFSAAHFHAGLPPETKKDVQRRFIKGEIRVIAATNAFGMGIDKPDVRLVIHADIPGSLENYLQEAGRAGRDRQQARCVLLYTDDDVERQFGMSARSRLSQREIQAILKALRRLDRKKEGVAELVATTGEILAEDEDGTVSRDTVTDDTRVRTAVSWLEESQLLLRDENRVQVFPSSLRVSTLEEARARIAKHVLAPDRQRELLCIVEVLLNADADEGVSTDELMVASGLNSEQTRAALYDLERVNVASNDTALTAYVHAGVDRSSMKRLSEASDLEVALIELLRAAAPDLGKSEASVLHLRLVCQRLKDDGLQYALPEMVWRLLKGLSMDGRTETGGIGSIRVRRRDRETVEVTLQREWQALDKTAQLRRSAGQKLLEHLLACLPKGARGTDLLSETTLGKLLEVIEGDLMLKGQVKDTAKLMDRALLWLHEQEVLRLNKGLAVFRPAMTIRLSPERRNFVKADYSPLQLHYQEQVVQIHVMAEYAQRGLQAMADALRLAMDYFTLPRDGFVERWLTKQQKELERQTTPASWRAIVESLRNPRQQRIVADDREQTSVLVLAGPGSGKTRVLVHRIAYLIRVRRENPHGIIALAYNRHAAVEIRRRLYDLIGNDARGVAVLTCHALAMRLVGASFADRLADETSDPFKEVLTQAIAMLRGDGLSADEADEQRDRLMAGFRWILVDEYQDIGLEQYELISALAGRTRPDEDGKLTLFAVGDDDQNIYAFNGASVEFIRRFEQDYGAASEYLVENYRSTGNIIAASNAVIAPARGRMKAEHPIRVDKARFKDPEGGCWEQLDPVTGGRVQILESGSSPQEQAVEVVQELRRLAARDPTWNWSSSAVIAREWKYLDPVRAVCEQVGIPWQMANDSLPAFWRLREPQALLDWFQAERAQLVHAAAIRDWLAKQPPGPWWSTLAEAIEDYAIETRDAELPVHYFRDWLAEWGRELRRRQIGLLLLTAHRAKGLEFDNVAVLDGGWDRVGRDEDRDAPRRLYYVAMTRARSTLILSEMSPGHPFTRCLANEPAVMRRTAPETDFGLAGGDRIYQRLSLQDVDLSFAGRYSPGHAVHRRISALSPGDALQVEWNGEKFSLKSNGCEVGRLARQYAFPDGMECVAATVYAVTVRRKADSEGEYADRCRSERWETIVPELVLQPRLNMHSRQTEPKDK